MRQNPATARKPQARAQTSQATREPRPRPSHRVYQVTGNGEGTFWREIGAAWPNRDGHGFNISYDVMPLHGRIVMRRIRERAGTAMNGGGQ